MGKDKDRGTASSRSSRSGTGTGSSRSSASTASTRRSGSGSASTASTSGSPSKTARSGGEDGTEHTNTSSSRSSASHTDTDGSRASKRSAASSGSSGSKGSGSSSATRSSRSSGETTSRAGSTSSKKKTAEDFDATDATARSKASNTGTARSKSGSGSGSGSGSEDSGSESSSGTGTGTGTHTHSSSSGTRTGSGSRSSASRSGTGTGSGSTTGTGSSRSSRTRASGSGSASSPTHTVPAGGGAADFDATTTAQNTSTHSGSTTDNETETDTGTGTSSSRSSRTGTGSSRSRTETGTGTATGTGTGKGTGTGTTSGTTTATTSRTRTGTGTGSGTATTSGTGTGSSGTPTQSSSRTRTSGTSGTRTGTTSGSSSSSGTRTGTTSSGSTTGSSSSGTISESESESESETGSTSTRPQKGGARGAGRGEKPSSSTRTTTRTTTRTGTTSSGSSGSSGSSSTATGSSGSSSSSSASSASTSPGTTSSTRRHSSLQQKDATATATADDRPPSSDKSAKAVKVVAGMTPPPGTAEAVVAGEAQAQGRGAEQPQQPEVVGVSQPPPSKTQQRKGRAGEGDMSLSSLSKEAEGDVDTEELHAGDAAPAKRPSGDGTASQDAAAAAAAGTAAQQQPQGKARYASDDDDAAGEGTAAAMSRSQIGDGDTPGRVGGRRRSATVAEADTDIRPIRDKIMAGGVPHAEVAGAKNEAAKTSPRSPLESAPVSPIPLASDGDVLETPRELVMHRGEDGVLIGADAAGVARSAASSSSATGTASSSTASEASYVASLRSRAEAAGKPATYEPTFTAGGTVVMTRAPAISMSNDPQHFARTQGHHGMSPNRSVEGSYSHGAGTPWLNASQVGGAGWLDDAPKIRDASVLSTRWWGEFSAVQAALVEFPAAAAAAAAGGYYSLSLDVSGIDVRPSSVLQLRVAAAATKHGKMQFFNAPCGVVAGYAAAEEDMQFVFTLPDGGAGVAGYYLVVAHTDPSGAADADDTVSRWSTGVHPRGGDCLGPIRGWSFHPIPDPTDAGAADKNTAFTLQLHTGSPDLLRVVGEAAKNLVNASGMVIKGALRYHAGQRAVAERLCPMYIQRATDPPPGLAAVGGLLQTDQEQERGVFHTKGFSVALPAKEGLQVLCRRVAEELGVAGGVTAKQLVVEAIPHDATRAIAGKVAHRLALAAPRNPQQQQQQQQQYETYTTAEGHRWKLPLHPRTGIIYQLVLEIDGAAVDRVVLAWHLHLPFAAGRLTTDTERGGVVKARASKGPFVTCGGTAVMDRVVSSYAAAKAGAAAKSVLQFEFAAWVSDTPETRREVERRKAAVREERHRRKAAEVETRREEQRRREKEKRRRKDEVTPRERERQRQAGFEPMTPDDRERVAAMAAALLREQGTPLRDGSAPPPAQVLDSTIKSLADSGVKITPELLEQLGKQLKTLSAINHQAVGEPSAPITEARAEQVKEAPAGYKHKPYCKGTCGGRCNFEAPEQPEPVYPHVPPEVKVVSVQPDALFLEPEYVLRKGDYARMGTFRFIAPATSPAPPMAVVGAAAAPHAPRTPLWPSSRVKIEFRALLKCAGDCPSRLLFRYRLHGVGEVVTDVGCKGSKPELTAESGAGIHILRPAGGGRDGVSNAFELLAPQQPVGGAVGAAGAASGPPPAGKAALPINFERYLQEDSLYVEVLNAETHFLWGVVKIDLFPLHRTAHQPLAYHVGEAAVTDPMSEEIEREPLDVSKPHLSASPELKGSLIYQLINEGTAEVLPAMPADNAPAKDMQNLPPKKTKHSGKHRVVAKKIFEGELAALGLKDVNIPQAQQDAAAKPATGKTPGVVCGSTVDENGAAATAAAAAAAPAAAPPQDIGDGRGNLVYFKCEASDAPLRAGWALASTNDCNTHLQAAARAIDDAAGSWAVCALSDGHMRGRGYGCVITKSMQEPPRSFRLAIHRGPLDDVDRKMVNESTRESLRRARADFAKDRLLRDNQARGAGVEAGAQPPVPAQAHYHDLEDRLDTIARLRAKGRRREALLKAQLQDSLTHDIAIEVAPGRATLVELTVKNPFGVGYVFTADIRDDGGHPDELGVITQLDVWRALCADAGTIPPPDHEVIRDGFGNIFMGGRVPVAGSGGCRVPLQFLSYADGCDGRDAIKARTAVVYMRDTDATPRAIFQIRITPVAVTHVHREIRLYGAPKESLRRWVPVGLAAEDHAAPARRNPNAATRRKLMAVRATAPCGLTSFIDWQTSRQGHVVPVETLQIEGAFGTSSGDANADASSAQTFMVFFYSGTARIPCLVWRVHVVPCTVIAGFQRYMGQTSELCVPLTSGCDEATRHRLRFGIGHGVLGEAAGTGDWKVGLKSTSYTAQGFVMQIRPVDDVVRRVRGNAVAVADNGVTSLHEPYLLMVQGKARTSDPCSQPPVTQIAYQNPPKVFRWTISHTNTTGVGQTYTAVYSPHGDFDVAPRRVGLAAGQSQVFTITFTPSFPQTYHFSLWINDAEDVTLGMHRRVFEVRAEYDTGVLEVPRDE